MGRRLSSGPDDFEVSAGDADMDLFSWSGSISSKLQLISWTLTSEVDIAENLRLKFRRVSTFTGGLSHDVVKLDEDDSIQLGNVKTDDTGPATAGDLIAAFQWDQIEPLTYKPPPRCRVIEKVSSNPPHERMVLHLGTALAQITRMSLEITWEVL